MQVSVLRCVSPASSEPLGRTVLMPCFLPYSMACIVKSAEQTVMHMPSTGLPDNLDHFDHVHHVFVPWLRLIYITRVLYLSASWVCIFLSCLCCQAPQPHSDSRAVPISISWGRLVLDTSLWEAVLDERQTRCCHIAARHKLVDALPSMAQHPFLQDVTLLMASQVVLWNFIVATTMRKDAQLHNVLCASHIHPGSQS